MMRRLRASLALATAALALGVGAAMPEDWLQRMDQAFRTADYDGVFSYLDGELSAFRIVHKVVDGIEHERLVYLDGARREIIRVGDEVSCIAEAGDELHAVIDQLPEGPYARAFSPRLHGLGEHYDVRLKGQDRIAGRTAIRLAITPRDDNRYGYRIWLDQDTALLLRAELHDEVGRRLEVFQFTSLRTGDDVTVADASPSATGLVTSRVPPAANGPLAPPAWRARWVPSGFRMTDGRGRVGTASRQVSTLLFSDGIATFSVFVETAPARAPAAAATRRGATSLHTRLARGPQRRSHLVTVVGEVPAATARRIAEGIHYAPEDEGKLSGATAEQGEDASLDSPASEE